MKKSRYGAAFIILAALLFLFLVLKAVGDNSVDFVNISVK